MSQSRAENSRFFASFMSSIEATQHGVDVLRNGPLEKAQMLLKEFEANGDDLEELKEASRKARTALVTGSTLDIKFTAATIAISTGYLHKSKTGSPSAAKQGTVKGSLENVVKHFATTWADPSRAGTAEGRKVLSFLLNLVSCVCVLPPDDVLVVPALDSRLLPAFGVLCAAEPELRRLYPDVGNVAVEAMLKEKTMHGLMELAMEVDEDVTSCESKDEIIQILLASEKALLPGGATGDDTLIEEGVRSPLRPGKGAGPAVVVAPIPGPPVGSASTDRAALMAVYHETNGPPEKKARPWAAAKGGWQKRKGWGKSSALGDWDGVGVDRLGRVATLELQFNNLKGPIPSALGGLTALQTLHMHNNQLSGVIPPELGWLTALTDLQLQTNKLTGPIPPELGQLTALRELDVSENNLSGSIPRELSQLAHLSSAWFIENYFDGALYSKGTSPNSTQLEGGITFIRHTRSYVGQAAIPSHHMGLQATVFTIVAGK